MSSYKLHLRKNIMTSKKKKKISDPNFCPNSTKILPGLYPNIAQILPELDTLEKLGVGGGHSAPRLIRLRGLQMTAKILESCMRVQLWLISLSFGVTQKHMVLNVKDEVCAGLQNNIENNVWRLLSVSSGMWRFYNFMQQTH